MHIAAMHNNKDDHTKTTIKRRPQQQDLQQYSLYTLKIFFIGMYITVNSLQQLVTSWGYTAIH